MTNTQILASSMSLGDNGRNYVTNFKGWNSGAIALYYGLVSRANYGNAEIDIDHYYIRKNSPEPIDEDNPRKWEGWTKLGVDYGISKATLYRAKKSLLSMTAPYQAPHGLYNDYGKLEGYVSGPVIEEDDNYIKIYKVGDVEKYMHLIPAPIMSGLVHYMASPMGGSGDSLILRLYSMFKIISEKKIYFTMAQILYAMGKDDKQYSGQANQSRAKVINAMGFLAACNFCRFKWDKVKRSKFDSKNPSAAVTATDFATEREQICGVEGLLEQDDLTDEQRKIVEQIVAEWT